MVQSIVWTEGAIRDLVEAADYIAVDSQSYAAAFLEDVTDAAASLATLAYRGRVVPELHLRGVRERIVRGYCLIYAVRADRVVIWALVHARRDLKRATRGRPLE